MKQMRSLLFIPLLAGTVVCPLHGEWITGLRGGYVDGASSAINSSNYAWPTVTNSYLDAHATTNYASSGDIWAAYRTWVYWGLIQLSGSVTFSLNIDDRAYLEIDGVQAFTTPAQPERPPPQKPLMPGGTLSCSGFTIPSVRPVLPAEPALREAWGS